MDFRSWLDNQSQRKDQIGRLARFMVDKELKFRRSRRRKPDEHRRWASTITYYGDITLVRSFNKAWQEYQNAKASP